VDETVTILKMGLNPKIRTPFVTQTEELLQERFFLFFSDLSKSGRG
jgi:hypothetical protein